MQDGLGRERQHGAAGPSDVGQKQGLSGQTYIRDTRDEYRLLPAIERFVRHRQHIRIQAEP